MTADTIDQGAAEALGYDRRAFGELLAVARMCADGADPAQVARLARSAVAKAERRPEDVKWPGFAGITDGASATFEPKDAWFIWTKHGKAPRMAHSNPAKVRDEALRLAHRFPGRSFLILHAIERVRVEIADVEAVADA